MCSQFCQTDKFHQMGLECCQSVHNVAKLTNSTKLVQNVNKRQLQIKPLYILPAIKLGYLENTQYKVLSIYFILLLLLY